MRSIIPDNYVPDITTLDFLNNEFGKLNERSIAAAYRGDFLLARNLLKFSDAMNNGCKEWFKARERYSAKLERECAEREKELSAFPFF